MKNLFFQKLSAVLLVASGFEKAISTSTVINFDEINALPAGVTPVGVSGGLKFNSFAAVDNSLIVTGLKAKSLPNGATTNLRTQLLDNPTNVLATAPGAFTSNYAGSSVESFTLHELYLGCALSTAVAAAVKAIPCTVRISAVNKNGRVFATKLYRYEPKTAVDTDIEAFDLVTFDRGFQNIYTVLFELIGPVDQLLKAVAIDDVKVTLVPK